MSEPRLFDDRRLILGESPRRDPAGRLVWVDIVSGEVLTRGDDGSASRFEIGSQVPAVLVRADGAGLVVARERQVLLYDWEMRPESCIVERVPGSGEGFRINDCNIDPAGRLLLGTTTVSSTPGAAALWRLEESGELRLLRPGATISNGLDWSPDGTLLYYVDSPTRRVVRLEYADELSGEELFVAIEDEAGVPDGVCVDGEGNLWVALNGSGEVRGYRPDGSVLERISFPVEAVTSCVVYPGEPAELLVTTAAVGLTEEELLGQPGAGMTFSVRLEVTPPSPRCYAG